MSLNFARIDRVSAQMRRRSPRLFRVYLEVCLAIDVAGEHAGSYTGSTKALARALRLDPAQVRRALKQLVELGMISAPKQGGGHVLPSSPPQRPPQRPPLTPLMSDGSTVFVPDVSPPASPGHVPPSSELRQNDSKRTPPTPPRGESADAAPATPPSQDSRKRSKKKSATKTPPNPQHQGFIEWWSKHYPDMHNEQPYVFQGARDGAAVQHLVASYSIVQLQRAVLAAWRSPDPFHLKQATTITGFRGIAQQILATPEQVRLDEPDHYHRRNGTAPRRESKPERVSSIFNVDDYRD